MNTLVIEIKESTLDSFKLGNNVIYDEITINLLDENNNTQNKFAEIIKSCGLMENVKKLIIKGKLLDSSLYKRSQPIVRDGYFPEYTILSNRLLESFFNKKSLIFEELYIDHVELDIHFFTSLIFINNKIRNYFCFNKHKMRTYMKCIIPNKKVLDIRYSNILTKNNINKIFTLSFVHRFMIYSNIEIIRLIVLHNYINCFNSFIDEDIFKYDIFKYEHRQKIIGKKRIINLLGTSTEAFYGFSPEFTKLIEDQYLIISLDLCHNQKTMEMIQRTVNSYDNCNVYLYSFLDNSLLDIINDSIEQARHHLIYPVINDVESHTIEFSKQIKRLKFE